MDMDMSHDLYAVQSYGRVPRGSQSPPADGFPSVVLLRHIAETRTSEHVGEGCETNLRTRYQVERRVYGRRQAQSVKERSQAVEQDICRD
jgi:hypothetical protein